MSGLTVVLLVTEKDLEEVASQIRDTLKRQYFIDTSNIKLHVRSGNVSIHRLFYSGTTLYVVLGTDTPATASLRMHSAHPVLSLPAQTISTSSPAAVALTIAKYCALSNSQVEKGVERALMAARQAALVTDAALKTDSYKEQIASCFDLNLQITGDRVAVDGVERKRGKVRDRWIMTESNNKNKLVLVTTDRQSGFDRQLAVVPYKGAVLNLCSKFWFEQTASIIPNHLVATPHPSVSIVRPCKPFPIEFVVRSYMTGSTSTSIWKNYQSGVRNYCGHDLPEGMTKNQKLPKNLLTPTTKEEDHDRPISLVDIVTENWMTQQDLDICATAALAVFALGQQIAADHGLILVDTKYEFGRCCETGEILLIDEVHTPDSSRYWLASSAAERIAAGKEPENIDKEFLRLWFRDHCDPYKDETIPDAPRDLVLELSRRYIQLYEMITWKDFDFEAASAGEDAISKAIRDNI